LAQIIAEDLVKHFEDRTSTVIGKAMVVCMSRDICAQMFKAIADLRPEWGVGSTSLRSPWNQRRSLCSMKAGG